MCLMWVGGLGLARAPTPPPPPGGPSAIAWWHAAHMKDGLCLTLLLVPYHPPVEGLGKPKHFVRQEGLYGRVAGK